MSNIGKERLREDFRKFLRHGMKIMVHSSLSSIGFMEGGAQTVICVLMEIITNSGLIMMPAFTYGREPFDLYSTPARTGKISEVFRQRGDVKRSLHPTHSLCAWGENACQMLSGHDVSEPFKEGTPLGRFSRQEGYVLLIGVTQTANSLIHMAQELARVPYLDRPKIVKILEKGRQKDMVVRRAGCSLGFDKLNPFLEKNDLIQKYKVGQAQIILMKAREILDKTVEVLKKDPYILACDNHDCFACNEMKNFAKE